MTNQALQIVHFSDLHIGMENYGRLDPRTGLNQRVSDFLKSLDQVVEYALEHKVDLLLFTGDAFRTRTPNPTYQREFARRLRTLSAAKVPTLLVEGNHDIPVMEQRASSLGVYEALDLPGIIVATKPAIHRIDTRLGILQVVAIPFPVAQRLLTREKYLSASRRDLESLTAGAVIAIIKDLRKRLTPDLPAILAGHFSVDAAEISGSGVMAGREVTIPLSDLRDPTWDYVALGHIHQHQNLNPANNPPVVYSGSLERVDFGEEGHPKGICVVSVEPIAHRPLGLRRSTTEWEFVPVPARRFCTVQVDVRTEVDPLEAVREAVSRHKLDDAVVRLIIQMRPEQEPHLRDGDLVPLIPQAFHIQINRDVERPERERLAREIKGLSDTGLLQRYLESQEIEQQDIADYLALAQEIMEEEG